MANLLDGASSAISAADSVNKAFGNNSGIGGALNTAQAGIAAAQNIAGLFSGEDEAGEDEAGDEAVGVAKGLKYKEAGDPPKAAGSSVYRGSYDVTFFIQRADVGLAAEDEAGAETTLTEMFADLAGEVLDSSGLADGFSMAAGVLSGASSLGSDIMSQAGQLAMSATLGSPGFGLGSIAGVGPSGFMQSALGTVSQAAASSSSLFDSVANITQRVSSVASYAQSIPGSEALFSQSMNKMVNDVSSYVSSASNISKTISRGNVSDITRQLAGYAGNLTSSKDVTEWINNGLIGATSQASRIAMSVVGPQGLLPLSKKL